MIFSQLAKTNAKSLILLIWMTIMPLLVSSFITYYVVENEPLVSNFGLPAWTIFFLATCFSMGLALTPTTFIALLSGYFLGMKALPFLVIAYSAASLIGFGITKFIDHGKLLETLCNLPGKWGRNTERFINGLNQNQFAIVILSRISPVLPFAMMNVVLSLAKVRLRVFLVAGIIGMLPRTALSIWLGSQAQDLIMLVRGGNWSGPSGLLLSALLIVSVVGLYVYIKRIMQKYVEKAG